MNTKKILFALACVLAATVAAQPAQAQFLTRAERTMITQGLTPSAQKQEKQAAAKTPEAAAAKPAAATAKTKAAAAKPQKAKKANTQVRIPGREMRIVYSSDALASTGKKCFESVSKAILNAAEHTAHNGPGGIEGAQMRAGQAWLNRQNARQKKQVKQSQDAFSKALEKADLQARKKAQNK